LRLRVRFCYGGLCASLYGSEKVTANFEITAQFGYDLFWAKFRFGSGQGGLEEKIQERLATLVRVGGDFWGYGFGLATMVI